MDILLLKIVRNLSVYTSRLSYDNYRGLACLESKELLDRTNIQWDDHIHLLVKICLLKESEHDALVELIGILSNIMYWKDLKNNWTMIINQYSFLDFLKKFLVLGMCERDLLLEIIILVGEMCDNESSSLISGSGLIEAIDQQWYTEVDDEISLQILTTYFQFLIFPSTRKSLFCLQSKLMLTLTSFK